MKRETSWVQVSMVYAFLQMFCYYFMKETSKYIILLSHESEN